MIPCLKCGKNFDLKNIIGRETVSCNYCRTTTKLNYYPALFKPFEKGNSADKNIEELEASCFNHVDKKAVAVCSDCGIYVCALCEIDRNEKKLCSGCFNKGFEEEKKDELSREYMQYCKISSNMLLVSIIIWPIIFITAPYALYNSIKGYGKSEGYFRGIRKAQSIINITISGLICLGIIGFFIGVAIK